MTTMQTPIQFIGEIVTVESAGEDTVLTVAVVEQGRIWFGDVFDLYDGKTLIGRCQLREFSLRIDSSRQQQSFRLVCRCDGRTSVRPGLTIRKAP